MTPATAATATAATAAAATTSAGATFLTPALLRHPLTFPSHFHPAEDLEYSWILEFILRQPIPDSLTHQIFLSLPFCSPNLHPRLRKTLLLRRLSSDLSRRSISLRTLHSLELIEDLERRHRPAPARLKSAYCAAAVECTAAAHRRGPGEFRAHVEEFWMERFFHLLRSDAATGLVSDTLLEWGKRMVHCQLSGEGGDEVLKSGVEDAVRLVKEYVDEALEDLGPTFLEIAEVEFVPKNGSLELDERLGGLGGDVRATPGGLADKCGEGLEEDGVREGLDGDVGAQLEGLVCSSGENLEDDRAGEEFVGKDGDNVVGSSRDSMDMEVEDNQKCLSVSGHDKLHHSEGLIHKVDPNEVTKVKEALRKSSFDLNMAVNDPLPEAHIMAAAVLASMSSASTAVDFSRNPLEDVRCNVTGNLSDSKHLENNHASTECNKDQGLGQSTGIAPCGTLFSRKPSARTYEWSDDSDDSYFEKSHDNHQSPNPMTRRVFLPKLSKGKFVRKRATKRWTSMEEDALREAVAKHGKGNWKLILNNYEIFEERTEVDLKDKWRNMSRYCTMAC